MVRTAFLESVAIRGQGAHSYDDIAGAEDIGTWYMILEVMSVMAVICNSAIIFFTGERFADVSLLRRTLYFIIFEHLVLGFKFGMAAFIPDVPGSVQIQLKRQELLTAKVRPCICLSW